MKAKTLQEPFSAALYRLFPLYCVSVFLKNVLAVVVVLKDEFALKNFVLHFLSWK